MIHAATTSPFNHIISISANHNIISSHISVLHSCMEGAVTT